MGKKKNKKEDDDCHDSADEGGSATETNVLDQPVDRIFVCGLELRKSEAAGRDKIAPE